MTHNENQVSMIEQSFDEIRKQIYTICTRGARKIRWLTDNSKEDGYAEFIKIITADGNIAELRTAITTIQKGTYDTFRDQFGNDKWILHSLCMFDLASEISEMFNRAWVDAGSKPEWLHD